MNEQNPIQRLTNELEHDLTARYGVMLGSNALWRELGFRSPAAFRVALSRGMIGVPFFTLPNRRGRFALAKDIAAWIANQRHASQINEADCAANCDQSIPSSNR
ncbi:MAG: hypothetical protein ACKVIS_06615 [Pseudomonadales bacterium]